MSNLLNVQGRDPFIVEGDDAAMPGADREIPAAAGDNVVHIRCQARNTRKNVTTISGIDPRFNVEKILRGIRSQFGCNGAVKNDPELGKIIQIQGDHRVNVANFLYDNGIVETKSCIRIHGH